MRPIPIVIKHLKKKYRSSTSHHSRLVKDIFKTTGVKPIPYVDNYGRLYFTFTQHSEDDMC